MKVGVTIPQGWTGEYDGWDSSRAWRRTQEVALQAERLGFESIWIFDHFHTVPRPINEITFESFTSLAALGAITERVLLGHIVICAGFRNPALTAKVSFSGTRTARMEWDLVYLDEGFYDRATGTNYDPDTSVDMPFESF